MDGQLTALDLFCGGGGAALGLIQAGFDVVGVDNNPCHAKVYPGTFVVGDATRPPFHLADFDFVWASPPCQAFSTATAYHGRKDHPNLIPATRALLAGHPYTVIENVPPAPIRKDIVLTGPMVGLGRISRRRYFEVSWLDLWPPEERLHPDVFKSGRGVCVTTSLCATNHYYARKRIGLPGMVPIAEARKVMGVETKMTARQIGEAVPPAYARLIAESALRLIRG